MDDEVSLEFRTLMSRFRAGDREAAGELVSHLYPELRRLAAARMRMESQDHTWSPTILVHELYLELVKIRSLRSAEEDASEKDAFLALAGHIMRRLLIHHSRPLYRRANKLESSVLDTAMPAAPQEGLQALAEIESLLNRLWKIDPKLRQVVELRAFEGKTAEEAAETMGCSPRSVHKYWSFARHWLGTELDTATGADSTIPA